MTVIDVDTGEIIPSAALVRPPIASPGDPVPLAVVLSQCAAIEVWAERCDDVAAIRDASNKVAAIASYFAATHRDGRKDLQATMIRLQVRIGELLGPTQPGKRHDLETEPSPASEGSADLTPNERSQMRKMADHPEIVEAVIDDSTDETPASRRRVLDEINRRKHAEAPEPGPDELRAKRAASIAKSIHKAHELFTLWQPEDIHDLNDPDLARGVVELMRVVSPWWEQYKATQPAGLRVVKGGK